jgi:hypothetical protein
MKISFASHGALTDVSDEIGNVALDPTDPAGATTTAVSRISTKARLFATTMTTATASAADRDMNPTLLTRSIGRSDKFHAMNVR